MVQRLPVPVIDADGHVLERQSDIRKYLQPPWTDRPTALWPGDQPWDADMFGKLPGTPGYPRSGSPSEQVAFWLEVMDDCNMERAVLFPTGSGNISKLREKEYAIAVCRAANDHFAKEYNALSDRVRAVGVLPVKWPEEAAKELRRAVTELKITGFELLTLGLPDALGDPIYDPMWEEADRLGATMAIHGNRNHSQDVGGLSLRTFAEVHTYAFPAALLLQFTSIVCQGVPVRFPNVRIPFLEIGATWLPYWLDRMDEHWELRGEVEMPYLKKKPSAVVREAKIYVSLEAEETLLPQTVEFLGDEHFLYASDIPHWDAGFPGNLTDLWENKDLSRETKERILYHNAKACFSLGSVVAA